MSGPRAASPLPAPPPRDHHEPDHAHREQRDRHDPLQARAALLVHELRAHPAERAVHPHISPPEGLIDLRRRLRLRIAHDRLRVHAHPDLVEGLGQQHTPAPDVRLDLRRGPGIRFRHRVASVVVSGGP
ncbi:hypothetical protein STTU_2296 [Streptomyces sp. Tu6071]|nr:hypothetical protein STTU_2296 [Streptomyces sp. Tu6071]